MWEREKKEAENVGEDESLEWNEDFGEIRTGYPIEVVVVNNDVLVKTMLKKALKSKRKIAILKKMKNTDMLIKSN